MRPEGSFSAVQEGKSLELKNCPVLDLSLKSVKSHYLHISSQRDR